ncbi:MAG: hypothetical protein DI563_05465 [Variovorax paradoxus]|uniref:Uncharacterized protein n=1 Tax=Variovorax paradoxus TaxID=34073 RepID=A0A2W5SQ74_VARPD|nr:MAG: hypothetical protein DI563_05465 [Variovorax paradoxus]
MDWFYAASAIYRAPVNPFAETLHERLFPHPSRVPHHDDPLGRLVACACDVMRTRHCNTPAYLAFLSEQARQREVAEKRAGVARAAAAAARTAKERAEEDAFYADGGTATEWAIEQEAKAEAKAQATKKRAVARTRNKARSTPSRTTTKEPQ